MIEKRVKSKWFNRAKVRKKGFSWHMKLAWVAGVVLLAFIISGLTHPILSWTGPQSTAFRPPQASFQANHVNAIKQVILANDIQQAIMLKLVPSRDGVVLQVTQQVNKARRYFDLESHAELFGYDETHAQWLARHYVLNGDSSVPIKSIHFQDEFDDAYPSVNRLLPVYKVTFDNKQNLSVFVYTEINALAGISNNYKTRVQSIFRALHNWAWLQRFDNVRIIIISLLLVCLIAMIVCGMALLFVLARRNNLSTKMKLHRSIAYVLWLPLLAFCISGFWHLLHYGFGDAHHGLKLGEPISLSSLGDAGELVDLPEQQFNHVSLTEHKGEMFYRMSVPATRKAKTSSSEHAHHQSSDRDKRIARFKGQASERGGLYYSVAGGQKANLTDKQVALELAVRHLQLTTEQVNKVQLVTRFGSNYDFRNKRLPVWQIDAETELGDKLFVDPATGMLVDRLVDADRYEGFSFSNLHKWSFLTPLTGRFWRDVIMVVVLSMGLLLAGLGLSMRYTKTKANTARAR